MDHLVLLLQFLQLFLFYINNLKNPSKLLDPIMFDDDTDLFFSHNNIRTLFRNMMVHVELCYIQVPDKLNF